MTNTGLSINSVGAYNSNVINTLSVPKAYDNINSNNDIDIVANVFNASIKQFEEKNNYKDNTITEPLTLSGYINSLPYRGYETQKIIHQLIDNIPNSYNPLHAAAYYGYLDIMEFLLEQGIDIDVKSDNGDTPLLIAALTGNLDGMKFLVEKGADVKIKNNEGFSVLHIAAQRNVAVSAIKFLIKEGANINAQDKHGSTPLHYATRKHADNVKLLIEEGANINAQDEHGSTPLHYATRQKHADNVKLLIEEGANINAQDNYGNTPLHIAIRTGYDDSAKLLIQLGADINVQDNYGNTPLHDAVRFGQNDIIKLLIEEGANINVQDNYGNTPLDIAISENHTDSVELLTARVRNAAWFKQNDIIKLPIEKGVDINEQDERGKDNTIKQEHVDSAIDKYPEESDIESTTVADSIDTYNKTFVKDSQNQDNNALTSLYYYLAAGIASVITFGGGVACYLLNKKQHKNEATSNDSSYYNYQNPESNLIEFMGKPVIIDGDNAKKVCVMVSSKECRPLSEFLSDYFHNTIQYLGGYHPKSVQDGSSNTVKEGNNYTVQEENTSIVEVGGSPTVEGSDSGIYDYLPPPRPVDFSNPDIFTVVLVGDSL
ncbi:ankyrin repeat domain-containing protein [Candidatus Tisiphia endosymbiont of Oplodontha viridula]|uniref:ankyrin repeat domain-containing protein n=1 Tax=Candidatus Tisiphia endosymbiont of Oplodontha viridula TaxID=3077925 RepID=UPI0035C89E3C